MEFVAIDVETANADMASICQIGIAKFVDGKLVGEWSSLINPEDDFSFYNTKVHGISQEDVVDSPTLLEVASTVSELLSGTICVSHTHFDKLAIQRVFAKYSLEQIETTWLDSALVVRRTWDEFAQKGYGLANVCKKIGYEFQHHDALEDAKAAGYVMLAAFDKTGHKVSDWADVLAVPIKTNYFGGAKVTPRDGSPEGALFGEVVVFTGELTITREDAAELAAKIGCTVKAGVSKKVTLLVVGDRDVAKFGGKDKSSKHIKAEELISKGHEMRILKESDFLELVNHAS